MADRAIEWPWPPNLYTWDREKEKEKASGEVGGKTKMLEKMDERTRETRRTETREWPSGEQRPEETTERIAAAV